MHSSVTGSIPEPCWFWPPCDPCCPPCGPCWPCCPMELRCGWLLWPGFAQFCPTNWSSSGVRSDISVGRNPTVSITYCFSATDFSCSAADSRLLFEHCSFINSLWSSVRSFKLSGGNHALFIVIKGCFIPVLAGRCRRHRRRPHE